ncbi:nitroreductase family protein [Cytobacillus solani]|uniref:nitroreductase family protein n=1 Tax=Cytobacillus solani TaxID=1637975 RepID=UPI0011526E51|nr:nitroreductase family protein [Cytobacillus solani]USK56111.1 nitroreductase family protein [Cytobacillus solani]
MEVIEAVKTRRSTRSFDPRVLPTEIMKDIENAILNSPSGSNAQESHFVIVQDERQIKNMKRFAPGLSGNPAAIVVLCSNANESFIRGGKDSEEVLRFVNLGIAAAYILLTAHSDGVGNCPVRSFHKESIKRILDLPPEIEPELLISLGYADRPPRPKTSKHVQEVISFDHYGKY